ncbi:MAG: Hsp33 family molecular chaperone HslO [Clostridia bacterium]
MNTISKAILFGGKAIVTALDTKDMVQKAIDLHKTSDLASCVLGRMLTMTTFMSSGFKSEQNKLSVGIDTSAIAGRVIVSSEYGGNVRGYIENKDIMLPLVNGKQDIIGAIGKEGILTVIKDFNMKEPYNCKSGLLRGDIASDFAFYFTMSEQLPTAISLAVDVKDGKCLASGGIIVQPMPNCDEGILVVLEDIVNNFKDYEKLLTKFSTEEIIDQNFGHFEIKFLPQLHPEYKCRCSKESIKNLICGLGKKEAYSILEEQGKIEVLCQYCSANYTFNKEDIDDIFAK